MSNALALRHSSSVESTAATALESALPASLDAAPTVNAQSSIPAESKRLAALRRLEILDTVAEQSFDDLALLAAHICQTPISLVTLVDEKRQWFKARVGISVTETPREHSICTHAIQQRAVFTVRDTTLDERFAANPLVLGAPKIRFYAGAPLVTADGEAIGTICVIDSVPRELSREQLDALQALSRLVMKQIESRLAMEQLAQTRNHLATASRLAGMAEVTTGILHNVGNVLNSVNVAANCLTDRIKTSRLTRLTRVTGLLRQHKDRLAEFLTTDERGQQLPAYLEQLVEHLADEQTVSLHELAELRKNIDHIKDIVALQQSGTKVSGLVTPEAPVELVETAVKINRSSLERQDIEIIREFAPVPRLAVEKHKVLQILVNLVRNATQAFDGLERTRKRLHLKVVPASNWVQISVRDNGCGIPSENLPHIFAHGFTTKKNGHGFGLHASAQAARELGGRLTVHSAGPGTGATFTLELPVADPEPRSAAPVPENRAGNFNSSGPAAVRPPV